MKKALSLPLFILLAMIAAFLLEPYTSILQKEFFYSLSLSLRALLLFMLPWIIFSSVYRAFSAMRGTAVFLLSMLLLCIIFSNTCSVFLAGFLSFFFSPSPTALSPFAENNSLQALWVLPIQPWIHNGSALALATFLALCPFSTLHRWIDPINHRLYQYSYWFLDRFFIRTLPLFIFGFFIKLFHERILQHVMQSHPTIFLFILGSIALYLSLLFLGAGFLYQHSWKTLAQNIFPPAITAFSTMSSAAALPLSLEAARKNTGNALLSDMVMPTTMNSHMIGDAIAIPLLGLFLLNAFHLPMPSWPLFSVFALSFVITKFSGAGVPGGSILIMIPVLESTLGFNSDLSSLITLIYILLDPFISCANVLGNNLFVLYFNRLILWLKPRSTPPLSAHSG